MPIKVLVADDSPTIRRRAAATLSEAGYEVTCVESGEAAWALLEAGDSCQALLCDILMPGMDGYELCERVKRDARLSNLPVLLLRGTFEPWDQGKAERVGADGFITKPFDANVLLSTLSDVLGQAQPAAPFAAAPFAAAMDGATIAMPAIPPGVSSASPFGDLGDAPPAPEPLDLGSAEPGPLSASDGPFGGIAESPAPPAPAPPPARSAPAPAAVVAPPAATTPARTGGGTIDLDAIDDALLDRLAAKVVARLSAQQLERLAWEVVPDVAEALVKKRLHEIESKLASE